ncbi:hypothetical protein KR074_001462, partial [Drosophila pseudoananassae]
HLKMVCNLTSLKLNKNIYLKSIEICGLPHSRNGDLISCEAYIPSWTYNSSSNECIKFIYGGCRGNDNRFGSKQACEEKCLE